MMDDRFHSQSGDLPGPREGAFDAQLALPTLERPPLTAVVKADGREEAFDREKLATSIYRAAKEAGLGDRARADSLARAVTIYLAKRVDTGLVPVADVRAAVERVLLEMGHVKTAMAFTRHRKVRSRRAATADLRSALHRAYGDEAAGGGPDPGPGLFVRTSGDTLVEWRRDRIEAALVRETGLGADLAAEIARQVEAQIIGSGITALTAALIRELVDAKLVEHGLDAYRRRHMRLGVPFYDTERIICTPASREPGRTLDPADTDRILAERVKREFALAHVYAQEVGDAHLRGDIHIHHLGLPDRLEATEQSLATLGRWGLGSDAGPAWPLAQDPEDLVRQWLRHSETLRRHVAGSVAWDAVNVYLAPYLHGMDETSIAKLAADAVAGLLRRVFPEGPVNVGLATAVPAALFEAEAVGPEGSGSPLDYGGWSRQSRLACDALLRAIIQVHEAGRWPGGAAIHADVPTGREPLNPRLHDALRAGCPVTIRPSNRAYPQRAVHTVLAVSINMPRLAYEAMTEAAFFAALEDRMAVAVAACAQKWAFAETLLAAGDAGPWHRLCEPRGGRPDLDAHAAQFDVGVLGLAECARYFSGRAIHAAPEAQAFADRAAARLAALCRHHARETGLNLVLAGTGQAEACQRLALLDLERYPEAAESILSSGSDPAVPAYTAGACLPPGHGLSPLEQVQCESQLAHHFDRPAVPTVALPGTALAELDTVVHAACATGHPAWRGVRLVP